MREWQIFSHLILSFPTNHYHIKYHITLTSSLCFLKFIVEITQRQNLGHHRLQAIKDCKKFSNRIFSVYNELTRQNSWICHCWNEIFRFNRQTSIQFLKPPLEEIFEQFHSCGNKSEVVRILSQDNSAASSGSWPYHFERLWTKPLFQDQVSYWTKIRSNPRWWSSMETDADLVQRIASSTQRPTRPASTGRSTPCTWRTFTSSLRGFGMILLVFPCHNIKEDIHKGSTLGPI